MTVTTERAVPSAPTAGAADAAALLRRTLRRHAAGVTVITVPGPAGFTATSFTSVSLDPALVTFYLGLTASTARAVQEAGHFAVHVLGPGNAALAQQFARSGTDRFAGVPWTQSPQGVPILGGVPAWLTARVTLRQRIGDHLQVVGEVETCGGPATGPGLVHHDGVFGTTASL